MFLKPSSTARLHHPLPAGWRNMFPETAAETAAPSLVGATPRLPGQRLVMASPGGKALSPTDAGSLGPLQRVSYEVLGSARPPHLWTSSGLPLPRSTVSSFRSSPISGSVVLATFQSEINRQHLFGHCHGLALSPSCITSLYPPGSLEETPSSGHCTDVKADAWRACTPCPNSCLRWD